MQTELKEEWFMYFGLLETSKQLKDIIQDFQSRVEQVKNIINLRDDIPNNLQITALEKNRNQ